MLFKKMDKKKLFLLLFVCSTLFFLYQHSTGVSWDFSSYVLNAKYIYSDGFYIEWYRPPLPSFILFTFSMFGWLASEYLYIIAVSGLFAFSCWKFSETHELDKNLFYVLMLSPFVLVFGLSIGTELLYLSLLILFITYLEKKESGAFFSLSLLTRYTNAFFILLSLFQKNVKKIIKTIFISLVVFVPWLLYNWTTTGNPFTSIGNAFAMNVLMRGYMVSTFNIIDILIITGLYTPFLLAGLYVRFKNPKKIDWVMLAFFALLLISFIRTPLKIPRYFFAGIFPTAYFTYFVIRKWKKYAIPVFVLVNFTIAMFFISLPMLNPQPYKNFTEEADNCMHMSTSWPLLNYYGVPTEPAPHKDLVTKELERGKRILIFKGSSEPDYAINHTFLERQPKIRETDRYILLGYEKQCAPTKKVDKTYLEGLRERGYNLTACSSLFGDKICNLLEIN